MMMELLAKKINEIEMPEAMQERIIRNCHDKFSKAENNMNNRAKYYFIRKPLVAAASLVLCFCLAGGVVLAATGHLQGFFKDITKWSGTVTGTEYEQATDEIKISIVKATDGVTVLVTIIYPDMVPYSELELLGIEEYEIVDQSGKVVMEGETTEMFEILDGKANVTLPFENVPGGNYKVVVSGFVGSHKGDQPLVISGNWECEFVY